MFFRRESLFKFEDINRLIDIPNNFFEELRYLEKAIIKLDKKILRFIHAKMEKLYQEDNAVELKKYMKLKRSLNSNKTFNFSLIKNQQLESLFNQQNEYKRELKLLKKILQEIFDSRSKNYNYFINMPLFRQALKDTNRNYINILDINNNKFRKEKTIYNYVQRSTVKCSPLSYFGTTIFPGSKLGLTQIKKANIVYLTVFLYMLSNIDSIKKKLRYNLGKLISIDGKPEMVLHDKLFFATNFDWVIKRDDNAYNKKIIELFKEQFEGVKSMYGEEIDFLLRKNTLFDLDFLIATNLINVDYDYYLTNKEQFQMLFEEKLLVNKFHIKEFVKGNLDNVDSSKFMIEIEQLNVCQQSKGKQRRITNFLKNQPLFYYNSYRLENFEKDNSISFEDFDDLIDKNYFYNYYTSCLSYIKKQYNIKNFFELLTFIKVNNSKLKKEIQLDNFGTAMKKSILVFFQKSIEGKVVLNNIHVGTGTILARDLQFLKSFSDKEFELFHNKIRTNYKNSFPIFELIFDMETSSKVGHLESQFPKIFFEKDLENLDFKIIDNTLQFYYNNNPINIIYTGTIPYYMFSGIKRIFLELLHPYSIDYQKFQKSTLSRSGISLLNKNDFKSITGMSDVEFFLFINLYFENYGLPKNFFLTEQQAFKHSKPVWFSLNSSNSLSILKRILPKSNFILNEIFPNNFKGKTVEYVYWLTKEE
ncbi:hypothetical protein ACS60E_03145 [Streptococcus suis]